MMAQRAFDIRKATIASGQTVSDAVELSEGAIVGLVIPAAFTGTTISFQASADGSVFQALYDETNTLVSMTVAVSRTYAAPAALSPFVAIKIVSGSAEGASREIKVVCKD